MATNESIVLGGGCFWCTEVFFLRIKGVGSVESGYAGGTTSNPTYEEVCSGKTGHAEVIKIEFNPSVISLEKILEVFLKIHDPTTLNQQGADMGTQYRSIILYNSDEQKNIAKAAIAKIAPNFIKPIVTEIKKLEIFYKAENYHQDYFSKNKEVPYCQVVILPKLKKYFGSEN